MMGGRIIFLNRFFWPDESATSQILSDVAFYLSEGGKKVTVVTSQLSYSNPTVRYAAAQQAAGVDIVRVSTRGGGSGSLLGKALTFASFYLSATAAVWRLARKGDILVAKTDPPLLSVPIMLIARLRRARLVTWLQDLYPELAAELGVGVARGPVGQLLKSLRNASLRAADANVVIGERMRELLLAEGISNSQIITIPNWTADQTLFPDPPGYQTLREQWGFTRSDIVVGYSGNLGRAHDIETLLNAAALLQSRGRNNIYFLFVGGGKLREQLDRQASELGLSNIVCRPYVERAQLAQSMAVADIHWLSLRPELEGMIVPSKFYGIAASARPALFVGSPDGEIARLLAIHDAGLTCPVGEAALLAEQIARLADDSAQRARLGSNARHAIERHFGQQTALAAWSSLIDQLPGDMKAKTR